MWTGTRPPFTTTELGDCHPLHCSVGARLWCGRPARYEHVPEPNNATRGTSAGNAPVPAYEDRLVVSMRLPGSRVSPTDDTRIAAI